MIFKISEKITDKKKYLKIYLLESTDSKSQLKGAETLSTFCEPRKSTPLSMADKFFKFELAT